MSIPHLFKKNMHLYPSNLPGVSEPLMRFAFFILWKKYVFYISKNFLYFRIHNVDAVIEKKNNSCLFTSTSSFLWEHLSIG